MAKWSQEESGRIATEIRNMEPVPKEAIRLALEKYICLHVRNPENIDLAMFRVIYRWVVLVHTLEGSTGTRSSKPGTSLC